MLLGLTAATAGSILGGTAPAEAAPGPKSRMPWNSGVCVGSPNELVRFQNFRRRAVDTATVFMVRQSWNDIQNAGQSSRWLSYGGPGRPERLVYSFGWLPAQPKGFAPFYEPSKTSFQARWNVLAAALGRGGSDDCEPHWVKAADSITKAARNGGHRSLIVRIGWEFTSKDYPWSAYDVQYAPAFKRMWSRCANILKNNRNGVQVLTQWDPLRRGQVNANIDNWYPEGSAVDIIGVNYYEGAPVYKTQEDWNRQFFETHNGGPWGLGAWLEYAKRKGKKFGIAEWGVHKESTGVIYVANMFEAFKRYSSVMAYENLYEHFGGSMAVRNLSTSSRYAAARAEYLKRWGG